MVARLGLIASSDQLGVNVCVHSFLSLWIMSESPTMIRLLSASVASARRAGQICREVLSSGKLGVVDKVRREGGRGRARERAPNYFDTCIIVLGQFGSSSIGSRLTYKTCQHVNSLASSPGSQIFN